MARNPTRDEVRALLEQARQSFPHNECLTCECFLGYLTQLGIDAGEAVDKLIDEMGIESQHTRGCMGCDPCPPADLFADYLQGQASSN